MPDDEDDIEVFKYAEKICQLTLKWNTLTYMNMQIFVILIC